jgi:16S rRNA G966 N2-methylase RsmD
VCVVFLWYVVRATRKSMAAAAAKDHHFPAKTVAEAKSLSACLPIGYDSLCVVPGESVKYSLMPWQVAAHKRVLRFLFDAKNQPKTIIDACAHIGCDTRLLAATFPKSAIVAFELNDVACECLRTNTKALANISVVSGDCMDAKNGMASRSPVDLVYLDPPWPEGYKSHDDVRLTLNGLALSDVLVQCLAISRDILVKVPRNFDMSSIKGLPLLTQSSVKSDTTGYVFYQLLHFRAKSA